MPSRRISSILIDLIGDDWPDVRLWFEDAHDYIDVRISAPHFGWSGQLTPREWHRLVTVGTNWLGHSPVIRDLEALRAGSSS